MKIIPSYVLIVIIIFALSIHGFQSTVHTDSRQPQPQDANNVMNNISPVREVAPDGLTSDDIFEPELFQRYSIEFPRYSFQNQRYLHRIGANSF